MDGKGLCSAGRQLLAYAPPLCKQRLDDVCPYPGECLYNLSKFGDCRNAKSDTKTDTNRKTCKKKSPLGSGSVNNVVHWT